jgi:hypothetical protein
MMLATPPSSAEVKHEGAIPLLPFYACMAWTRKASQFMLVLIPYQEADAVFVDIRVHVMSLTSDNAVDLHHVGGVP